MSQPVEKGAMSRYADGSPAYGPIPDFPNEKGVDVASQDSTRPPRKEHVLVLTTRELRLVRQALELGRDQTVNPLWRWWHETQYANALYQRVLDLWENR